MVNGTDASEFCTRFWPTRLMYSVMIGSEIGLAVVWLTAVVAKVYTDRPKWLE
jgi:hypothetical protein